MYKIVFTQGAHRLRPERTFCSIPRQHYHHMHYPLFSSVPHHPTQTTPLIAVYNSKNPTNESCSKIKLNRADPNARNRHAITLHCAHCATRQYSNKQQLKSVQIHRDSEFGVVDRGQLIQHGRQSANTLRFLNVREPSQRKFAEREDSTNMRMECKCFHVVCCCVVSMCLCFG